MKSLALTRATVYALNVLLQLSECPSKNPVPCRQLAGKNQLPERFLLHVLRLLVNAGMLNSIRGVDGGFSLARPIDEITIFDVIQAVDGACDPKPIPTGLLNEVPSSRLDDVIQSVTDQVVERLSKVRVSQLAEAAEPEMVLPMMAPRLSVESSA